MNKLLSTAIKKLRLASLHVQVVQAFDLPESRGKEGGG
jgi:hypothetical protein